MNERYFIVFWEGQYYTGFPVNGILDATVTNGLFINKKETERQIKELNPDLKNVSFKNIIELDKNYFKAWKA